MGSNPTSATNINNWEHVVNLIGNIAFEAGRKYIEKVLTESGVIFIPSGQEGFFVDHQR